MPKKTSRDKFVTVRYRREEARIVKTAATKADRKLSDWIRIITLNAATEMGELRDAK